MQDYGLEWFFRLVQEPQRLWKRYLFTNSFFIYLFFKELLLKKS
jgi:N-acetylglucosaminyldiphosphoundecaprenol N-acetyl-beta-D-mannosaminyltransferase